MKKVNLQRRHDLKLVLVTILVCAIIAGLVQYHVSSVQAAEKRGWLKGSTETLTQIKSILK